MSPPEALPTAPATILIVDDDTVVRTIMSAELQDEGFRILEAGDGLEALEVCRSFAPDLLIVDVVMPRMDGFELCRALRGQSATASTPILMATGLDDEASIGQAYVAGATDFIVKPVQWMILRHRVRYMLRSAEAFEAQRRDKAELRAAKEAAEAGDRAKSEFLATMSHELRTPLNAVIGLSTMMRSQSLGALSPRYLEFAGLIEESGQALLEMIEDVLDLASAEVSDLTLTVAPVDVAHLIAEVDAATRSMASEKSLTFASSADADLAPLMADRKRLRRMLVALVGNAVKFNRTGGEVRLSAGRDEARNLVLKVSDTGIGMSPETLRRALTPFGQADGTLGRRYGGAGVGLPLAQRLAALHGAAVEIESIEGQGTVVSIRVPADRFAAPSAGAAGKRTHEAIPPLFEVQASMRV